MNINITVKRKFIVNGNEYASPDDMPEDIRQAYEKAMTAQSSGASAMPETTKTIIVFNGREYTGAEEMPAEARAFYETALRAARTSIAGNQAPSGDLAGAPHDRLAPAKPARSGSPVSSFSRWSIVALTGAILLIVLYFLLRAH